MRRAVQRVAWCAAYCSALRELGCNVASPVVYGLLALKGTPRKVVDVLYGALKKVATKYSEQIGSNLAISGADLRLMGPEEYAAHLRAQQKLYLDAVRHLDLVKYHVDIQDAIGLACPGWWESSIAHTNCITVYQTSRQHRKLVFCYLFYS